MAKFDKELKIFFVTTILNILLNELVGWALPTTQPIHPPPTPPPQSQPLPPSPRTGIPNPLHKTHP
jgi:hypothetical protein